MAIITTCSYKMRETIVSQSGLGVLGTTAWASRQVCGPIASARISGMCNRGRAMTERRTERAPRVCVKNPRDRFQRPAKGACRTTAYWDMV